MGFDRLPLTYQFTCSATETGVRDTLLDVRAQLSAVMVDADAQATIEIALAEALNNIVEHACTGRPEATIRLDIVVDAAQVFVLVQDPGDALPGGMIRDLRVIDLGEDLASLPEGGFGWPLIHMLTDRLDYSRVNGVNRLKMWFPRACTV